MKPLLIVFVLACAVAARSQSQRSVSAGATNTAPQRSATINAPVSSTAATANPAETVPTTILTSVLLPFVVAVLTSVSGFWFALRQFRIQKWWELKAEAYSRIVEALHNAKEYCSARAHEDMSGEQISPEREKQLSDDYGRAYLELRKVTGMGAYIISVEAAKVLDALENRPRLIGRDGPKNCAWFEVYEADAEAYGKALADIRALAHKDLKIRRS